MSTSHHTVPVTTTTNTYDKNATNNTASTTYDKDHPHHNEHAKDEFHGTQGTSSSIDNLRNDGLVKTGDYTTGLEAAHGINVPSGHAVPLTAVNQRVFGGVPVTNQPTTSAQLQNTHPNAANRDGLVVNDGIGGARGGATILGGQCECTRNGGQCVHGAGNCVCRGCTTKATTINPGINIGVSTTQYTAPTGTTGIGGGVSEFGTGIAGLVHANNAVATHTNTACECVKKNGACTCAPGRCDCTGCKADRLAKEAAVTAAAAKAKHDPHNSTHHLGIDKDVKTTHHYAHSMDVTNPHRTSAATGQTTHFGQSVAGAPVTGAGIATHAQPTSSTSTGAYSANDYIEGKPVGAINPTTSQQASNIAHPRV